MATWPKSVGFIGLGIMGGPMASNLLKAGLEVVVHDLVPERVQALVDQGAKDGKTISGTMKDVDLLITMLPDSPDLEAVVFSSGGVAESAGAELLFVDMSTVSPDTTKNVAQALGDRGVKCLDAPVSGGPPGAEDGTLTILVGGSQEVFDRCLPVFRHMGKTITRMGDTAAGQTAKLCNQIMIAMHLQAVCEGLLTAAKAGLDLRTLLDALLGGAARSFILEYLGDAMIKGDFTPGFKVRLEQKDLRLALQMAETLQVPLPGTSMVHQLFRSREAAGGGDTEGTQALLKVYEELAHYKLGQ